MTDAGASGRETAVTEVDGRRALEVSGLDRHLLVHDTVAEALDAAR